MTEHASLLADPPQGSVRGITDGSIVRFLGIPYAAAPTGEFRFRPPVDAPDWEGVREAGHSGPICPQNPSMMDVLFGSNPEAQDEDCLLLNVTAPIDAIGSETLRPVMVWIHGGGFEMGSGSSPMYDGAPFAERDTVLVSLNYRLGSLGFLYLDHLDPTLQGSGNLGLLDQMAALRWVQRNISAFGGDPNRVTVFGQSAGSMSTSLLLSSESATGLFHQAIAQSGALNSARSIEFAISETEHFMELGGWTSIEALRQADCEDLLAAHAKMGAHRLSNVDEFVATAGTPLAFLPFRPVADGIVVPHDPLHAVATGAARGIALMTGSTFEEWKLFSMMAPAATDEEHLLQRFSALHADPQAALRAYQFDHPGASLNDLEGAFLTDLVFRVPVTDMAEAQSHWAPAFLYEWMWQSPAFGGAIGAAHAVELPFLFQRLDDPRMHVFVGDNAPAELADTITDAWVRFAHHGRPDGGQIPDWPTADQPNRPTVLIDVESKLVHAPRSTTYELWRDHQLDQ